jgi:hypothetical protein
MWRFRLRCVWQVWAAVVLLAGSGGVHAQDAQTWSFNPPPDTFQTSALLDLRSLNERVAGESGFVTAGKDGQFRLGNATPARFWAVNTDVARERVITARPRWSQTPPDLARHARFLAKRGVNMVRLHAHLNPKPSQGINDIDADERDWIWRTVAAMKKEGIYTTISPYWAVPAKIGAGWNIPGGPDQSAFGLLFFDEKFQRAYTGWLRNLFAEKNPYTGIPLAQDASVAIIQIQNEDSLLFWTVNGLKGEQRRNLGAKFARWATTKYGSFDAAFKAWENDRLPGDLVTDSVLDFHNIWEMTQERSGGRARRLDDQLQFWAETMQAFNTRVAAFLRIELECRQLINAGNWRTADAKRMLDAERWSYTANEVIAVNRYFGGMHVGPNNGWAIGTGDQFTSPSALHQPWDLPINIKQVTGYPTIVSESSWVLPNANGAEGPFLIAAYQSLNGVGPFYWFATEAEQFAPPRSANGYMPSQSKWTFATPDILGTFPAAALLYRSAFVKQGAPVVHEERTLADLWQRKVPVITEETGFDPNRDSGNLAPRSNAVPSVPVQAFLAGPVVVKFAGDPANTRIQDMTQLFDPATKTIKSNTGELTLNYDLGFSIVDAPKAQGVAAHFAKRGTFQLTDIAITSRNAFGSVLVVAMDDQPLKVSGKVLVQVGTRARPTGWKETAVTIDVKEGKFPGYRVDSYGAAPWQVTRADVEVSIRNQGLRRATTLDMNGMAVGPAVVSKITGGLKLVFPPDAMYVVLE